MNLFTVHKKLNAFTLLELLVGMILSGIVLTAAFSAFHIVTRQYENYRKSSDANSEVSFFVSQLQSDFSNALTVTRNSENKIGLHADKRELEYTFEENYILRNDMLRTDTFKAVVTEIETYSKSEKIIEEEAVIDQLTIFISMDGKRTEKIYLSTPDAKSVIDKEETDFTNGN